MKRPPASCRVAVIFDMFGPYHLARLTALSAIFNVMGVEISRGSKIYDWEVSDGPVSFDRRTLFATDDSSAVKFADIQDKLSAELESFQPDVVLSPGWASRAALAAMTWCASARVPIVVMSESTVSDQPRKAWREYVKRPLIDSFSAAIVGGQPQREYLTSLGMDRGTIFLGYNAVDNLHFWNGAEQARANRVETARILDLPARYFLASARFIPIKNLICLLDAFSIAVRSSRSANLSLVVLGGGALRGELEAKRAELGLTDRISFPGFRQYDALPAFYGLAEAFVHISKVEPWGLVVNEAMAAGLPVIVSDECGCATTLVEEGGNGYRVPAADIDAIAERICRLADDSALRSRFGRRSRDIVAQWSPDKFASGVCEAVMMALAARPVPQAAWRQLYVSVLARAL